MLEFAVMMVRRRAATVAVGLLVLSVASCADDTTQSTPAPSITTSPEPSTTVASSFPSSTTTSSTTTSSPATTALTSTSTTEPAAFPYWTPECTERMGDPSASYETAETLGAFTTLGAAPTLDLVIPEVVTSEGPYGSIADSSPIPGGVLVGVYPPNGWPRADEILYSSSLVAADDDGSIRWRRCFDEFRTAGFRVAPAELDPTTAWVIGSAWDEPLQIVGVDLITGADVPFPFDVSALGERGRGDRFFVLGPPFGDGAVAADDQLVVIDTLDGTIREIPVPPSWVAGDGDGVQVLDVNVADDEFFLADSLPLPGETTSVYADGAWTDDPAVLRDVLPPQVTETFGAPFELRLFDGAGDLVWAVPEFHSVSREGFHWLVANSVVLAMRCTTWDSDGACNWVGDAAPEEELVAFDIDTGQELWTAANAVPSPIIASDVGIVFRYSGGAADGYVLVDLVTGEQTGPDGDPWPTGAFVEECCGGYDYTHVERSGAVVIATDQSHVRVWYPPEFTTPTVSVDVAS